MNGELDGDGGEGRWRPERRLWARTSPGFSMREPPDWKKEKPPLRQGGRALYRGELGYDSNDRNSRKKEGEDQENWGGIGISEDRLGVREFNNNLDTLSPLLVSYLSLWLAGETHTHTSFLSHGSTLGRLSSGWAASVVLHASAQQQRLELPLQ